MENHETDYQRARRQRSEVKKYGITGSTPRKAVERIKEHSKSKALSKAKAYTGHYEETGTGQIRHQSPKQVKEKNLGIH